jgi:ABC-type multidrug transport system permease subunit
MKYRPSACHITAKVVRNQIHFGMEHTDRRKISHRALSLFQSITLFIKFIFSILCLFISVCFYSMHVYKTYRVFVFYLNLFLLSVGIFVAWIGVQGQNPNL